MTFENEAPQVPCHRVVASDLHLGGFRGCTSGSNLKDKMRMLKDEGVEFEQGTDQVKKQCFYMFDHDD